MFRYEVGATILVMRKDSYSSQEPLEVKILAKSPGVIKVKVLSHGWFNLGDIRILTSGKWYAVGRIKEG